MNCLLVLSLSIFGCSWADLGTHDKPLEITINRKNNDGTNQLIRRLSPALNEATSTSLYGTLWPVSDDGIIYIPYEIDSTASEYGSEFWSPFQEAIQEFNTKTNIRLIGRYKHDNYLIIHANPVGCWSDSLGLRTATDDQNVNIQITGCNIRGIIVHELGHVLGLAHTQKREDRDDYITVNWDNIDSASGWDSQYVKEDISRADDCGYYDYDSIMHYPPWGGAIYENGTFLPTMYAKDASKQDTMGMASYTTGVLSNEDVNCLNYLYVPDTMPVRIIPSSLSRYYVRHKEFELSTNDIISNDLSFLQDSTFEIIDPSLSSLISSTTTSEPTVEPPITVSFQSSNNKNWYIRASIDEPLKIDYNPGDSNEFYLESSFIIRQAVNEKMDHVSIESVKYPNYLVQLDADDGKLYIRPQLTFSQRTEGYLDSVSFKLECTFNHKSEYVDTCPQGKYVINDFFGGRTNALTTPEELKCNRSPLEGLIASNGTKRFKFHNDKIRDVVFTDCESTFDPKLRLFTVNGFDNGDLITPDNGCDFDDCSLDFYPCSNFLRETIQYSSLPIGDYYLQIQPWYKSTIGGIYSIKAYCPDGFATVDGVTATGIYENDNHLEPYIFALKPDVSGEVVISDCATTFDPKLIIYDHNFEIISSDHCDFNGIINDDCIAEGYSCPTVFREIIKMPLEANKNYFIGVEPFHVNSLGSGNSIVVDVTTANTV